MRNGLKGIPRYFRFPPPSSGIEIKKEEFISSLRHIAQSQLSGLGTEFKKIPISTSFSFRLQRNLKEDKLMIPKNNKNIFRDNHDAFSQENKEYSQFYFLKDFK